MEDAGSCLLGTTRVKAQPKLPCKKSRAMKKFLQVCHQENRQTRKLVLLIRMQKVTANLFPPHPEIPAAANEGQR